MAYKVFGIIVDGISVDGYYPTFFCSQFIEDGQIVNVNGVNLRCKSFVADEFPQISASSLDPFTGSYRSGSCNIMLSAKEEVLKSFMVQAKPLNYTARIIYPATSTEGDLTFDRPVPLGTYFINGETIRVKSNLYGNTYEVDRGVAGSSASPHPTSSSLYTKPPYWIGRRVSVLVLTLSERTKLVETARYVWSGYLSAAPQLVTSTSKLKLMADSMYNLFQTLTVNKNPATYRVLVEETRAHFTPFTPADDIGAISSVFKSVVDTRRIHIPELDTIMSVEVGLPWILTSSFEKGTYDGYELLTHHVFGHHRHPLFIALALLASGPGGYGERGAWDLLAPNFSLDIYEYLDIQAWEDLIEETPWMAIDQLYLGADGQQVDIWKVVVEQLLPAFKLAVIPGADGRLRPILVDTADVQDYGSAALVQILPEKWDWDMASSDPIQSYTAKVGQTPVREGTVVKVEGLSVVRDFTSRYGKAQMGELDWPFFFAEKAASEVYQRIFDMLVWRYGGLPVVTFNLDASKYNISLGDTVLMQKPSGLMSNILINSDGERVDDWATAPFIALITQTRPDTPNNILECKAVLTNYHLGKLAKWRAPGAVVANPLGTYQYELGLYLDGSPSTEAQTFTVGDEVILCDKTLAKRSPTHATIIAVDASLGVIVVSSGWGMEAEAGDMVLLADSTDYSNPAVVPYESYPYVFMTDNTFLPRPSGLNQDPDEYA